MDPINPKVARLYRDWTMLHARMHGAALATLAEKHGVTPNTVARVVKKSFIELQVSVMSETQGDPESPRVALFTLDDFNRDPQACRMQMLNDIIGKLERAYPGLKNGATD